MTFYFLATAGTPTNEPDVAQGNILPFGTGTENIDSDDNGNGFGAAQQGGPNNASDPSNPLHGKSFFRCFLKTAMVM